MDLTRDTGVVSPSALQPGRHQLVVVLDFGAQYAQLIARRIRECRVYCEIMPCDVPAAELLSRQPKGIVLSGGPASVYEKDAPACDRSILESGIPVLGICYGLQLIARHFGGEVQSGHQGEYGKSELLVQGGAPLFNGLPERLTCWMSHADVVATAPCGFEVTAHTEGCPVAAMADRKRKLFGVQFHPEVAHTHRGVDILRNFLYEECGCAATWTMESFVKESVCSIAETVGKERVLCALSGGIDSATVAALVHRAVGKQLVCMLVDHGFLREGEAEEVSYLFTKHFPTELLYVEASARFLDALRGVSSPEEKRRIIGREFIRVFEEEAAKLGHVAFLAQGTLYPDVIESGTRTAATIKTHHNVGGLPEQMGFQLLEPLRFLFKDEVRAVGLELGLPGSLVWRHPFPGPGLAVRIIGEVTPERLRILRGADSIVLQELAAAGLHREVWQAFAVLPTVYSVGVMGDQRTYAYPVVVRAVTSEDGMTADWARLPHKVLDRIATRVVNEVPGVNRVAYDVTSKPPATIEWE